MDLSIILKAAIIAGAVIVGLATTWIFKMPKDNPIEQIAEEIIKDESNIDIDLTPEGK